MQVDQRPLVPLCDPLLGTAAVIFDVTDPADPRLVGAIEGPDHAATWQVQVADGLLVQGMEHRPPAWGGDPALNSAEGIRFFDVSDPAAPRLLSEWRTGEHGVHRNHFTGGRYVHVTASRRGFDGNIYVILDIADPRRPEEVAMWFLPEQFVAAGRHPASTHLLARTAVRPG